MEDREDRVAELTRLQDAGVISEEDQEPKSPHERLLPVIEIFGPTIQGEGALSGTQTHFIRLGGCSYRCSWCDTMYAVDPKQVKENARKMSIEDILLALPYIPPSANPRWVTLSGGDPLLWDLQALVASLQLRNWKVAVETQGAHYRPWVEVVDMLTISPKPPSSNMAGRINFQTLNQLVRAGRRVQLKIPIFSREDADFAERIHQRFTRVPMFLTVGTPQGLTHEDTIVEICEGLKALATEVVVRPFMWDVTVQPQLHVLAWGNRRGV